MNSLKTLNNLDEVEGMEGVRQTRGFKRKLMTVGVGIDGKLKRPKGEDVEGMGNNGDIGFL